MINIDSFRDSTQIILPTEALSGLRQELNRRFVLSFVEEETKTRIIGSPTEIREASNWLTRQGVAVA
ncbi:VNG_1110C family protein [Halocatena halophila]|uniref:VNG_1110C family protein n=1 Tax=Halocatena halophila TaxID=2814576 RepID=UPI002ED0FEC5